MNDMRFFILAMLVLLGACGKSEERKLQERQAEFMEGCTAQVPSDDVCLCVYKHEAVSKALHTMETDKNDKGAVTRYVQAVMLATDDCVKQLGLAPASK